MFCPNCGAKVVEDARCPHDLGLRTEPTSCAYCGGDGKDFATQCPACGGAGSVLVVQPAAKCPTCGGDGRDFATRCGVCQGTGWSHVVRL